jgi:hypothetical protein
MTTGKSVKLQVDLSPCLIKNALKLEVQLHALVTWADAVRGQLYSSAPSRPRKEILIATGEQAGRPGAGLNASEV